MRTMMREGREKELREMLTDLFGEQVAGGNRRPVPRAHGRPELRLAMIGRRPAADCGGRTPCGELGAKGDRRVGRRGESQFQAHVDVALPCLAGFELLLTTFDSRPCPDARVDSMRAEILRVEQVRGSEPAQPV